VEVLTVIHAVAPKVVEGIPEDAIVEKARDWDADLIVVGSHGYGPSHRTKHHSLQASMSSPKSAAL
jgi:nucleotide-binding universal stress UspA family protein